MSAPSPVATSSTPPVLIADFDSVIDVLPNILLTPANTSL
jgi:hypothetical protein